MAQISDGAGTKSPGEAPGDGPPPGRTVLPAFGPLSFPVCAGNTREPNSSPVETFSAALPSLPPSPYVPGSA